jgi:type VI protein secretion system component VasF
MNCHCIAGAGAGAGGAGEEEARPLVDAMQLLVMLVRERSLTALDEEARVRREVLHW